MTRALPIAALLLTASLAAAAPASAAPEATVTTPTTAAAARRALMAPGRTATLRPTTLIERTAVDALVPAIVERARRGEARVDDLAPVAGMAALAVERWVVEGAAFIVLREAAGQERGTGAYVFRVGPVAGPEVVLQAPHAYFDLHTGRIAAAMMFDPVGPHPRALMLNTVQRYQRQPPTPDSPADVCHRPEHLFSHVTDRALAALGRATVVQLHGFDAAGVPAGTRAIVSEGLDRAPSLRLVALSARIEAALGDGVRVYHRDLTRLGGTTNAQARVVARHAYGWFVHLEMATAAREALRAKRALRRALAAALFAPVDGGDP